MGFGPNNNPQIAISQNGRIQVFSVQDQHIGYVFISQSYGNSWIAHNPVQYTIGIDVSDNFKYLSRAVTNTAGLGQGYIYIKANP
jgi:hypothetical protein